MKVRGKWPKWLEAVWRNHNPRSTSVSDARENIHHHYDLGNEFYELWLDHAEMQYTCACYESPDLFLEQAQLAKLEHVCRKLRLQPGQTMVEAGCGWGGLARYMARQYGEMARMIRRSLKPEGMALLHSIGRNRPMLINAWIEKRIFPGAYPPSILVAGKKR